MKLWNNKINSITNMEPFLLSFHLQKRLEKVKGSVLWLMTSFDKLDD